MALFSLFKKNAVHDFVVKKSKGDDTRVIQGAIDKASKVKGRVIFKAGTVYRSGLLSLRSNVTLFFEKGAMLKASDDLNSFKTDKDKTIDGLDHPTWSCCDYNGNPSMFFLYGKKIHDLKIAGEEEESTKIDGNEEIFYGESNEYHIDGSFYPRVPLIFLEDSKNIEISSITLTHSAFWTVHLVGCSNVLIKKVSIINNRKLANCDGIDPDHTKNLVVEDCRIEAADDCIAIKTTSANKAYGPCENLTFRNCTFASTSAAIKFGSETCSDIRNVHFENITIEDSNRGVAFQLRDEGRISDVSFSDLRISTHHFSPVEWWGKGEPVIITAVRRNKDKPVGTIKNISFSSLSITSENGLFLFGEQGKISDVSFKNIRMNLVNVTPWEKDVRDLRPSEEYPEPFYSPVSYVYLRNIDGFILENYMFLKDEAVKEKEFQPYQIYDSRIEK